MIIDWFTLFAQALNFLILVWLLRRFLYQPILDTIDAREKRIALALEEAEAKKTEALAEKKDFQNKKEQFAQQQASLMSKANDDAKAEGRRLLHEARLAAEAYRARRLETLEREQQSLNVEIIRRTRKEVIAIARKTLADLADASLEERMAKLMQNRLRELNDEKKNSLAGVLKSSSSRVVVRSGFDLPTIQKDMLQQTLNDTFSAKILVSFETDPEVVCGIELVTNGHKIAWSITEYLASLERSIKELLQKEAAQPTETSPPAARTSGDT